MENEVIQEFKRYMESVYSGEELDPEQYKQVFLAFHAGAVVWLKLMMKVTAEHEGDPEGGAKGLKRLSDMLFANCKEYTEQTKSVN